MATQKIHFFTGKGGVGKSVISASYALATALTRSPQVLLTELSDDSSFSQLFSSQKKPAHLSLSHWNAQSCLEEYATNLLHSSSLSKLFLNNAISRSLINVAPGLQELAILGKATSGPRKHGPPMNYDEVFIDAFASGHFLNLMSAPQSFAEMFSFGPMATQSKSIDLCIKNPDFSSVHIVTMADDLSIQESIELHKNLLAIGILSDFILNKYVATESLPFEDLPNKTQHFFKNIDLQQKEALADLKKTKALVFLAPQVFEKNLFKIVQKISSSMKAFNS